MKVDIRKNFLGNRGVVMCSFIKYSVAVTFSSLVVSVSTCNIAYASTAEEIAKNAINAAKSTSKTSWKGASGNLGNLTKKAEVESASYKYINEPELLGKNIEKGTQIIGKQGFGILDRSNGKATVQFLDKKRNLNEASFKLPASDLERKAGNYEVMSVDDQLQVRISEGFKKRPDGTEYVPLGQPFSETKMVADKINGSSIMKKVLSQEGDSNGNLLKAEVDQKNLVHINQVIDGRESAITYRSSCAHANCISGVEVDLKTNIVTIREVQSDNFVFYRRFKISPTATPTAPGSSIYKANMRETRLAGVPSADYLREESLLKTETIKGPTTVAEGGKLRGLFFKSTKGESGSR
jgi:hypothetical protein